MTVSVKLFAAARELAGCDELAIEVPDNPTAAHVRPALIEAVPALEQLMAHSLLAVDAQFADDAMLVNQRSEIALIPPVSGG